MATPKFNNIVKALASYKLMYMGHGVEVNKKIDAIMAEGEAIIRGSFDKLREEKPEMFLGPDEQPPAGKTLATKFYLFESHSRVDHTVADRDLYNYRWSSYSANSNFVGIYNFSDPSAFEEKRIKDSINRTPVRYFDGTGSFNTVSGFACKLFGRDRVGRNDIPIADRRSIEVRMAVDNAYILRRIGTGNNYENLCPVVFPLISDKKYLKETADKLVRLHADWASILQTMQPKYDVFRLTLKEDKTLEKSKAKHGKVVAEVLDWAYDVVNP